MAELLDGGGCDVMLRIFRKHGASDSEIVGHGCAILCFLTGSCYVGIRSSPPPSSSIAVSNTSIETDDVVLPPPPPTTSTATTITTAATERSVDAGTCVASVDSSTLTGGRDVLEYLASIGFYKAFIACISLHVGDAIISELGLAAIASLGGSGGSSSSMYLLSSTVEMNCCDVITQVGSFGFNMRHERCCIIATHFCAAVEVLCEAVNVSKLLDSGCSQMLVALMRLHLPDGCFSTAAIKAICGLASLSACLRLELMRYEVCEVLVEAYSRHSKIYKSIIRDVCEAILHLSVDTCHIERIGVTIGLCKILVHALQTHLLWIEQGAEIATSAMLHLVVSSSNATTTNNAIDAANANAYAENQYRFVDTGIMEALQMTLHSELLSFRTLDNLTELLQVFAVEDIELSSDSLTQCIVRLDNQQYCSVYDYLTLHKKEPLRATIHIVSSSPATDDATVDAAAVDDATVAPAPFEGVMNNELSSSSSSHCSSDTIEEEEEEEEED